MAKSISLESTVSFKATDSGLSKILFDFQESLTSTINTNSVQYGEATVFDTTNKALNIVSSSAGQYIYIKNVEDENGSQITISFGTTTFSTLEKGEFIYVKLRGGVDINVKLNTDLGQARCQYFLIEF